MKENRPVFARPDDDTLGSDKKAHRGIVGASPEGISSVEQFFNECKKVDVFLDDLEKDTDANSHIYKKGFWPKFIHAVETRFDREVRPNLKLSIDERSKDFRSPQAKADADLARRFLHGGATLPLPHVFATRLALRGAFQDLVENGLMDKNDRDTFMEAMPHWEHGLGGMSGHKQGNLLSDVLKKEMENREALRQHFKDKNIDGGKVDDVLNLYRRKLGTFWTAVRAYPDIYDQEISMEELRRHGLLSRDLLREIDEEAVKEYIQHMSQEFMREHCSTMGINITPHDLDGVILTEIEHGFTHAAGIPAALPELDEDSKDEIALVLSKQG